MKRFLLFSSYMEASCGWHDLQGEFDSVEEAKLAATSCAGTGAHVVDVLHEGPARDAVVLVGDREGRWTGGKWIEAGEGEWCWRLPQPGEFDL